jgi:hypothetical protein
MLYSRPITTIDMSSIVPEFDCQQIWSYSNMALVLFSHKTQVSSML